MPIYKVGNKKYNIPQEELEGFLAEFPQAEEFIEGKTSTTETDTTVDVAEVSDTESPSADGSLELTRTSVRGKTRKSDLSKLKESEEVKKYPDRIKAINEEIILIAGEDMKVDPLDSPKRINQYNELIKEKNSKLKKLEDLNIYISGDDSDWEKYNWASETKNQLRLTLKRIESGLERVPTFINEMIFSAGRSLMSEQQQKDFDALPADIQQQTINSILSRSGAAQDFLNKSNKAKQEADLIEKNLTQFDNTIAQAAFEEGNIGEAAARTAAAAIGSIPFMLEAMIPFVGIPTIVAQEAALASSEAQKKGEKITPRTMAYSTVVGASEGLLEVVTKRIGTTMFKNLIGKPADLIKKNVKEMALQFAKQSGAEGLSESGTLTINNAAEALILKDKKAFDGYMLELADTFIIGAASGGGMSGAGIGANVLRTEIANKGIKKELKKSKYNSIDQAFNPSEQITQTQVELSQQQNAINALNRELKSKLTAGEINKETSDAIELNFRETQGAVNQIKPLKLSTKDQATAVQLMKEKKQLSDEIKQVGEPNLTIEQSDRIKQIDEDLKGIGSKAVTQEVEKVKKAAESIKDLDVQEFASTQETEAFLSEQGQDPKASGQQGFIIQDPKTGKQTIVINREIADKEIAVAAPSHEFLHALLFQTVKDSPETQLALGNSLKEYINKIDANKVKDSNFAKRLEQYKSDPEAIQAEEVLTLFSDAIRTEDIKFNETVFTKIGDVIRKALQDLGVKVKFNNGKDVYNFIKDYNKSLESTGLTKAQVKAAEGIKGKLVTEKVQTDEQIVKESRSEEASAKVQELYDTQGEAAAFDIIEQFKPITSKIVEKRSEAPNFDRQLLTDEIETGKRGILDLIKEYDPKSGVPLAAYINKFLPARAIEASRRILGEEFTEDVTEAKGVVAEEAVVEVVPTEKQATSKLRRVLGIKQDDDIYNLAKKVSEDILTSELPDKKVKTAINREARKSELRKAVSDLMGTEKAIDEQFLNKNILEILKALPASDLVKLEREAKVKVLAEQGPRLNVKEAREAVNKGLLPKDTNLQSGPKVSSKLPTTLEQAKEFFTQKRKAGLVNVITEMLVKDAAPEVTEGKMEPAKRAKVLSEIDREPTLKFSLSTKRDLDWSIDEAENRNTSFTIGDKTYNVQLNAKDLGADQDADPTDYSLEFDQDGSQELTGKGDQFKALSIIYNGLIDEIKSNPNIATISFNALASETSRVKLYDVLLDKLSKKLGWTAEKFDYESDGVVDEIGFEMYKPTEKKLPILKFSLTTEQENKLDNLKNTINNITDGPGKDAVFENLKEEFLTFTTQKDLDFKDLQGIIDVALEDEVLAGKEGAKFTKETDNLNYYDLTNKNKLKFDLKNTESLKKVGKKRLKPTNAPDVNEFIGHALTLAEAIPTEGKILLGKRKSFIPGALLGYHTRTTGDGKLDNFYKALNKNIDAKWITPKTKELLDKVKTIIPASNFRNVQKEIGEAKTKKEKISIAKKALPDLIKHQESSLNFFNAFNSLLTDYLYDSNNQKEFESRLDYVLKLKRANSDNVKGERDLVILDGFYLGEPNGPIKLEHVKSSSQQSVQSLKSIVSGQWDTSIPNDFKGMFGYKNDFDKIDAYGKTNTSQYYRFYNKNIASNYILSEFGFDGTIYDKNLINAVEADLIKLKQKAAVNNNNKLPELVKFSKNSDYTNNMVLDRMAEIDDASQESELKFSKSLDLNKDFNDIIENKTGIASDKTYARVKAEVAGANKGRFNFFIPPSAEDFVGLLYSTLGKGSTGDAQMAWYKAHLINPFARAMENIANDRVAMIQDYKALKKALKIVPKDLRKKVPGEPFTREQAVRVYIWDQQGMEIPGLSKKDQSDLVKYVNDSAELTTFANQLTAINKGDEYASPDAGWIAGTIDTDFLKALNTTKRAKYLEVWQQNVDEIFSETNLNKLEAAYGKPYRVAMENILHRMKTGRNRSFGTDTITGRFTDWLTNSVGAIMFFNTRSAVLQTISAVNFINFSDNNVLKAGQAFANQPQYWADFKKLFNSPFLLDRRNGVKLNVNEADIAEMAKGPGNSARNVIAGLLKAGFLPTQLADSFAIAAGGATFYRNRIKALEKQGGLTEAEAEEIAFRDFREIAEESQQSSRPDKISQQQAGPLGRVVLAFANTPAQYARLIKKAASDLKNGRGDAKTNISKIIYYGVAQNVLFSALQQALFAISFGDDEEEEKKRDEKYFNIANGMADSILRGIGVGGAIASVVKNTAIKLAKEEEKKSPKYQDVLVKEVLQISPPISSKVGKLRSAGRSLSWNQEEMRTKGWSIDNPAYLASANVISAVTNVPADRAVKKITNLVDASNEEIEYYKRIALALGWSAWELNIDEKDKKKPESSTGKTRTRRRTRTKKTRN